MTEPTPTDRLLAAFRKLVRAEDPNRVYRGIYEYRVGAVSGQTADIAPTDTSLSLPPILRVPLRAGLLGETVVLTVGTTCLVAFVNGDPTRPMVIGADLPPQSATVGGSSTQLSLVGGGPPIARVGDQVMSFLPPTLPVTGTVSGNPFTGTITVSNPITGSITGGSSKSNSG